MARSSRSLIAPAVVALAALFIVLPRGGADAEVTIVDAGEAWAFSPASVSVEAAARVAFVNETDVTHTATCQGCPWDSGDIQPGQTAMLTFDDEVASSFFCRYHGASQGMEGQLVVGDPPVPQPSPSPSA